MTDTLDALRDALLVGALLFGGLQAGTYYAFSCGVMPGLARGDDRTFVATMQQVNVAIINPVFLATFLGAPLLAGAAVVAFLAHGGPSRPWLVAGLILALATVVVTATGSVPLNNALAAAGEADRIDDLAAARAGFEGAWVRWNVVRTITSAGSLSCLAWAAVSS